MQLINACPKVPDIEKTHDNEMCSPVVLLLQHFRLSLSVIVSEVVKEDNPCCKCEWKRLKKGLGQVSDP